jgi:hypothetical protein
MSRPLSVYTGANLDQIAEAFCATWDGQSPFVVLHKGYGLFFQARMFPEGRGVGLNLLDVKACRVAADHSDNAVGGLFFVANAEMDGQKLLTRDITKAKPDMLFQFTSTGCLSLTTHNPSGTVWTHLCSDDDLGALTVMISTARVMSFACFSYHKMVREGK